MPWHIQNDHPDCSGFAVVKDSDGKVVGCHPTKAKAAKHMAALYANEKGSPMSATEKQHTGRPPRDNLVRAMPGGFELRDVPDAAMPTMVGHFARFGEWTEIDSMFEGRFMERIARGAFAKTFRENRDAMRVTFQHGHDPSIGDKVLGPIAALEEDQHGARYEVPLLDTAYNRDLLPGLEAGLYGASFRFRVMKEDIDQEPERSAYNPDGIPERTIREAHVMEFGPVTFPAYAGATAGIRSLTDEFIFDRLTDDPKRLINIIDYTRTNTTNVDTTTTALSSPAPASATPEPERRDEEPEPEEAVVTEEVQYPTTQDKAVRIGVLQSEMTAIAEEYLGKYPPDVQARWDALESEHDRLEEEKAEQERHEAKIKSFEARKGGETERDQIKRFGVRIPTDDPYNRAAIYRDASSPQDAAMKLRDNAMRVVETTSFATTKRNKEDIQGDIAWMLDNIDGAHDEFGSEKRPSELARRILVTGSPAYRRAFAKAIKAGDWNAPMSNEERTVMAEGAGATGGFAITFDLDPTIVKTSNGAVNPYRRVCRTVSISGTNEWRAVSSGAVVATYELEATDAVDRSPTLAQPAFLAKRAQTFIPFSIELQQDWSSLVAELGSLIVDSKDTLEAAQFATGVGTTVFPQGQTVGFTNTATTGTTVVLAVNDIYKTEEALPPRFRPNAQWFANRFIYNKIRQLDTAGGANLWVPDLRQGLPNNETGNTGYNLIGYPANEASGMAATLASTTKLAVLCDPNFYVIVERIGLDIELIPHLFGTTANYPTGQRALYAMWRNTARVLDIAGGVTMVGL